MTEIQEMVLCWQHLFGQQFAARPANYGDIPRALWEAACETVFYAWLDRWTKGEALVVNESNGRC